MHGSENVLFVGKFRIFAYALIRGCGDAGIHECMDDWLIDCMYVGLRGMHGMSFIIN